MRRRMIKTKVLINEDEWIFRILPDDEYQKAVKTDDDEEEAEADTSAQMVTFKASTFCFRNIVHELYHVYVYYACIDFQIEIENDDMEEIHARVCDRYMLKIIKKACIIYKELAGTSIKVVDDFYKTAERMEKVWTSLELAAKKK